MISSYNILVNRTEAGILSYQVHSIALIAEHLQYCKYHALWLSGLFFGAAHYTDLVFVIPNGNVERVLFMFRIVLLQRACRPGVGITITCSQPGAVLKGVVHFSTSLLL